MHWMLNNITFKILFIHDVGQQTINLRLSFKEIKLKIKEKKSIGYFNEENDDISIFPGKKKHFQKKRKKDIIVFRVYLRNTDCILLNPTFHDRRS